VPSWWSVVVSTPKNQAKVIYRCCFVACPDTVICKYTSKCSSPLLSEECRDFNNFAWANVDILIYTSMVSSSCSFKLPHFIRVFAYFSSMSTDYKTAIQMLGQICIISTHIHQVNQKGPAQPPCQVGEGHSKI